VTFAPAAGSLQEDHVAELLGRVLGDADRDRGPSRRDPLRARGCSADRLERSSLVSPLVKRQVSQLDGHCAPPDTHGQLMIIPVGLRLQVGHRDRHAEGGGRGPARARFPQVFPLGQDRVAVPGGSGATGRSGRPGAGWGRTKRGRPGLAADELARLVETSPPVLGPLRKVSRSGPSSLPYSGMPAQAGAYASGQPGGTRPAPGATPTASASQIGTAVLRAAETPQKPYLAGISGPRHPGPVPGHPRRSPGVVPDRAEVQAAGQRGEDDRPPPAPWIATRA